MQSKLRRTSFTSVHQAHTCVAVRAVPTLLAWVQAPTLMLLCSRREFESVGWWVHVRQLGHCDQSSSRENCQVLQFPLVGQICHSSNLASRRGVLPCIRRQRSIIVTRFFGAHQSQLCSHLHPNRMCFIDFAVCIDCSQRMGRDSATGWHPGTSVSRAAQYENSLPSPQLALFYPSQLKRQN
eukprot:2102121-Pleurochrysis_carterae.AAC.3